MAAGKFDVKRATSGPMPYFTDDPRIASNYASNKAAHTSRLKARTEGNYPEWFKVKVAGYRNARSIRHGSTAGDERQAIAEKLGRIGYVGEGYDEIGIDTDNVGGASPSHWAHTLRENRGNGFAAAIDLWLNSANLFNQEEEFLKVLKLAGVKNVVFDSPRLAYPGVFAGYARVKNPVDTNDKALVSFLVEGLNKAKPRRWKAAGMARTCGISGRVSPKDWLDRLRDDVANDTTHAWTAIPDWVTEHLQSKGFDGIIDTGGKFGGPGHAVLIPFEPSQIRSIHAAFDPSKSDSPDFMYRRPGEPARWFTRAVMPDGSVRDRTVGAKTAAEAEQLARDSATEATRVVAAVIPPAWQSMSSREMVRAAGKLIEDTLTELTNRTTGGRARVLLRSEIEEPSTGRYVLGSYAKGLIEVALSQGDGKLTDTRFLEVHNAPRNLPLPARDRCNWPS